MRKVELTMNEQTKYEMVKQFVDNGERNIKRLSIKLNCSLKIAYNYVKKYKLNGKESFPMVTIKISHLLLLMNLLVKKLLKYTLIFQMTLTLILERDFNIKVSYTFLHKLLSYNLFYSPKCKKSTRYKLN